MNSSGVSAGGLPDFDIEPSPSTRESSGQEVGAAVQLQATAPSTPPLLQGAYTDLAELNADHISELFSAYGAATDATDWTYLPYGPFADERAFAGELERLQAEPGACYFAVLDGAGKAIGLLGLINVRVAHGALEIGHVHFSPELQRTPAATEALYLVLKYVFEGLRFRRVEWKCDALNDRSKSAALRFGFRFEGLFRQHLVYKGRNRDTAWFALLDGEWPVRKAAFERWLLPNNVDSFGLQQRSLRELMAAAVEAL